MPLEVTAFVVTSGETPYLAATLLAVSRQTFRPKSVYVIDAGASGIIPNSGYKVLTAPGASNLGVALEKARHSPDFPQIPSGGAVWILHDDSAPAEDCLEEQVKILTESPTTKIVGAKQRAWEHAEILLEVGIQATASGRRLQEMEAGEIDQGQYDNRNDVLGVGTAAMLLDWGTYLELEGFDPRLGPFGDGLEFCRRTRLAGYRVQVAPHAVVYHKMAGYYGLRGPGGGRPARSVRLANNGELAPEPKRSFTARRVAQVHNWMVAAPWWQLICLPLFVIVMGVIRVAWRIVTKEPKLAFAEIKSVLITLFTPLSVYRARRKLTRHRKIPRRALKSLQIKGRQIWQAKTILRRIARDANKPLITDHWARRNYAIEKNLDRVTTSGVAAILLVISLLMGRFGLVGITGGALPSLPAPDSDFWQYLFSGWLPSGLGYGSKILIADPLGLLLGILGMSAGWLGIPGPVVLSILSFATLPLAWLCAWWGCAVITTLRPLRAMAALCWALSPNMLISLGAGQIPVWVLSWMIPLFAGSLARACGAGRTLNVMGDGGEPVTFTVKSAAIVQTGVAALTGFVAVCASQILIIPLALLLLLGLMRGVSRIEAVSEDSELAPHESTTNRYTRPRRSRLVWHHFLIILMPSLWLVVPNLTRTLGKAEQWPLWISTLGVPEARNSPNWWDLLTGWPVNLREASLALAFPGWQWLTVIPVTLILALVLASIIVPGESLVSHGGAVIALGGLAIAWLSSSTPVALAQTRPVTAWAGPGLAVYHAALLVAALAFLTRLRVENPREVAGWGEKTLHTLLALAVLVPIVGAVPGISSEVVSPRHSEFGHLQPYREDMLPASLGSGQTGAQRWRGLNLAIHSAPNQSTLVEASVWRGWRDSIFEASPWVKLKNYQSTTGEQNLDEADAFLSQTVAALLAGNTPQLTEELASMNVNFILVQNSKDSSVKELRNSLDSTAGLERVTQTAAGTMWRLADGDAPAGLIRVAKPTGTAANPVWPTEAKIQALPQSAQNQVHLPGGEADRLLAISERWDANFKVRFDGKALEPVDNGQWNNLYRLPAQSGTLHIEYAYLPYQLWGGVLLVWLFIAFAAALPLRRVSGVRYE